MRRYIVTITAGFLAVVTGCATIISGTTQVLTFQSNPSGAEILVNGIPVGITPLTVTVKRKSGTKVMVKKEGYKEQSFVLKQSLEPWFWGNIIFGGLFGSTTDIASGATVEYSPDQYYTTLEPVEQTSADSIMKSSETPQNKAIRFILVNYNDIASELNTGSGDHIDSLLLLLNVTDEQKSDATSKIKNIFIEKTEIPAFAESVAAEFIK